MFGFGVQSLYTKGVSNMEREYTPMKDLLLTLNNMVKHSGMSLREIARKTEKYGYSMNNVCAVANGNPEQLASIMKFDTYISCILSVMGYDEYELIKRTLEGLTNPNSSTYQDQLSPSMREFLRSPESEKYLQYAYKRYQLDKLQEEQARLKKELENL